MNILTAYYHICFDILKKELPVKPILKLSDAKGYMGKICINKDKKEFTIFLSKFHLDTGRWKPNQNDIEDIVDTICHEFAHMWFWEHGEDHDEVTKLFKILVYNNLKIKALTEALAG